MGVGGHLIPQTPPQLGIPPGAPLVLNSISLAALQLEKSTHASRSDDAFVNKGKERGVKIQASLAPGAKQTSQNVSVQNDTYLGIISRQHYNLALTEGLER